MALFQKDLIVWKLGMVVNMYWEMAHVSEGLNSVETEVINMAEKRSRRFQKDLIVWKLQLYRAW